MQIHTWTKTHIYTYKYLHKHTHTHKQTHSVCLFMCVCLCVYVFLYVRACVRICMCVYVYVRMSMYVCDKQTHRGTDTEAQTHRHTHAQTHTHTHTHTPRTTHTHTKLHIYMERERRKSDEREEPHFEGDGWRHGRRLWSHSPCPPTPSTNIARVMIMITNMILRVVMKMIKPAQTSDYPSIRVSMIWYHQEASDVEQILHTRSSRDFLSQLREASQSGLGISQERKRDNSRQETNIRQYKTHPQKWI